MSNRKEYDIEHFQAASSLLSLGSKCGLSPITVETQEPDFNKAIASVIWSRHHHQTPSTVFKCRVSNCPLCPADDSLTCLPRQDKIQRMSTSKSSRRSSVVNWLISSSSSTSAVPNSRCVNQTNSSSPYLAQQSYPAPSSLTGSVYSNSDTGSSRSSPNSFSTSPFPEHPSSLRSTPIVPESSLNINEMPSKRQRLDVLSPRVAMNSSVIVERELPFSCQFCPKRFAQASNCSSHQRTHTGARPFQCPSCPKAFAQRTSLRTHLRTHTGDRPYRCQDCQQRFGDLSTLTKHRRTHTGERPYRCQHEGCQRAFAQSGNLKRHYKTHLLDRKLELLAV